MLRLNDKYIKLYLIHKINDGDYKLCRILNEYDSQEDVNSDLAKLL